MAEPPTSEWLFPLPKNLESLPQANLEEFVHDPVLVAGYIKTLSRYQDKRSRVLNILEGLETKNDEVSQLVREYKELSEKIVNQINTIQKVYREFTNLEIDQYRLLSNNFNQEFLISNKLSTLLESTHSESLAIAKRVGEGDFDALAQFRESRKNYHLRKEKLNRWHEERVSGAL